MVLVDTSVWIEGFKKPPALAQQAETLIAVLHAAVVEHGRPEKLLTDQGSGFYSWSGEQTRFEEYLDDHTSSDSFWTE